MLTFKQFSEAIGDYKGNWRNKIGSYDKNYYDKDIEVMKNEKDKPIAYKHKLIPKKTLNHFPSDVTKNSDDIIHRGISHDEYNNILKHGHIQSRGHGNIGKEQKGLTYFSKDIDSAGAYANSFAREKDKPTHDKPAYIVSIKKPHESRIKHVEGTGSDEVGIKGPIDHKDIISVHRGKVVSRIPGTKGSHLSSSTLHWEKIK